MDIKTCAVIPVCGTGMICLLLASICTVIAPWGMDTAFAEGRPGYTRLDSASVAARLVIPDSSTMQVIETTDGSSNVGRIVRIGRDEIEFETDLGVIRIPIAKIRYIETLPAASVHDGEIWFKNPNETRLFFAPKARTLEKGTGYFSVYYLFFPGFSLGISDRFTLGGGFSIFPGVDMNEQLFFIAPKIGLVQKRTFQLSTGALLVRVPDGDAVVGIVYGVVTLGEPDASLTAGLGYGFKDGDLADRPMVMVGAEHRFSQHTALVTENWIFPGVDDPVVSLGLRFFGRRLSVDLALINTLGEEAFFPGLPYVDFVYRF